MISALKMFAFKVPLEHLTGSLGFRNFGNGYWVYVVSAVVRFTYR